LASGAQRRIQYEFVEDTRFSPQLLGIGGFCGPEIGFDPPFAGNCGSFAEYRVSACRIALNISPSKTNYHLLGDTHEHPLNQTRRIRSRYIDERIRHGRPRISFRVAVSPEYFSDRVSWSLLELKCFE
jgi:hypothetical protein